MGHAGDSTRQRRSLFLRIIYALRLLSATYNHWWVTYHHGLGWDYGGFSKASATFWTTLAFIDPTAVILLFVRPNLGVAVTAAIIVVDVIHNAWIQAHYFSPLLQALAAAPQVVEQIAFMVFVVATCPFAWSNKLGSAP